MKTIAMAGACLAAACLTLAAAPASAPRAQAASVMLAAAPGAGKLPVAYDCLGWHRGQVRAHSIALSCFGSVVLKIPRWKYWTAVSARSASATLGVDDCKPNCVSGKFRRYAASVVLYRARWHAGVRYFSRLRVEYRHAGPRRYTFRWARYPGATLPVWVGGPKG